MDKFILQPGVYFIGDIEDLISVSLKDSILTGAEDFEEENHAPVEYLMVDDFADGYMYHATDTHYIVPYRPMKSNVLGIIPNWMIEPSLTDTTGFVNGTVRVDLKKPTTVHVFPLSVQLINPDVKMFIDGVTAKGV